MLSPLHNCPAKRLAGFLIPFISTLFLFSGCAIKPWNNPLTDREFNELNPLIDTMRGLQAQCSPCLDGNVKISIETQLGGRKLNGYVLVAQPDKLKFVAHNPFGQPVVAVSGNESSFHYLDTMNRVVLTGKPLLLCRELGIPEVFASDSWGLWLTGTLPKKDQITEIREDKEGRGVWLRFTEDSSGFQEHILIHPETYRVTSRIITHNGGIDLRLNYHYTEMQDTTTVCGLPQEITISGFDYSTKVNVEFSDVVEVEICSPADFNLPTPAGYATSHFGEKNH